MRSGRGFDEHEWRDDFFRRSDRWLLRIDTQKTRETRKTTLSVEKSRTNAWDASAHLVSPTTPMAHASKKTTFLRDMLLSAMCSCNRRTEAGMRSMRRSLRSVSLRRCNTRVYTQRGPCRYGHSAGTRAAHSASRGPPSQERRMERKEKKKEVYASKRRKDCESNRAAVRIADRGIAGRDDFSRAISAISDARSCRAYGEQDY